MTAWAVILILFIGFVLGVLFALKAEKPRIERNYTIRKVKTRGRGNNINFNGIPTTEPSEVSSQKSRRFPKLKSLKIFNNRPKRLKSKKS